MSSVWGNAIKVSIWGQSHGEAVGVVMDGLPAGEPIDTELLQAFLDRRKAGRQAGDTPRHEDDTVNIMGGLYKGHTCGAPLSMLTPNGNVKSSDYELFANCPRPSHADFAAKEKFRGFNDPRGGGHFSGRLTAALCMAGGIAVQLLERRHIRIRACLQEVGGVCVKDRDEAVLREVIASVRENGDSAGGLVSARIEGLPVGLGEPFFDSVESVAAALLFSIPGVKGVEFGSGFALAAMRGGEANDAFTYAADGRVVCKTNHSGGINGGLSNGMPVTLRVAFRPTPSISRRQQTVNLAEGKNCDLVIEGRYDVCIALRAVVCVEAALALAILDLYFQYAKNAPAFNKTDL